MKIVLKKDERGYKAYIDGKKHTTPFVSEADFCEWIGCLMHFGVYPADAEVLYHGELGYRALIPTYASPIKERPRQLI